MDDFCLMNRIAWAETLKSKVFKTYYKTVSDNWTEQKELGNWQQWNNLYDGCMYCEIRHEEYYSIAGIQYDNLLEAKNAMLIHLFKGE